MIRHATPQDAPRLVEMLVDFANATPTELYKEPHYDYNHLLGVLADLQRHGLVLLGEIDGKVQGMLLARVVNDIWLPQFKVLREVAWWVDPAHRKSSLGYRLLKEYHAIGQRAVEQKRIANFVLTTLVDSPIRNLSRWGWRPVEQNYVYEGRI